MLKNNDKITQLLQSRLILFIFGVLLFLIGTSLYNIKVYQYDAWYYWIVADPVFKSGFNIYAFPETFRGCLFPIFLSGIKKICNSIGLGEYWGWRMCISFLLSSLYVFILPVMFNDYKVSIFTYIKMILISILLNIFWGDFLSYPLSDLPAFFFMLLGTSLLVRFSETNMKLLHSLCVGIGIGVSYYISYNTRVAFIYGIICALLVCFIYTLKGKRWKNIFLLLGIILGLFVSAIPQMLINNNYIHKISPKVYTEQLYNYDENLQTMQLYWGILYPRYETYMGDFDEYPIPNVFFDDPVGQEIIKREDLTENNFGIKTLLKILFKYPSDLIGIYSRHLVSVITPIWSQIFITNIYSNKGLYILSAIVIWILAVIALLFQKNDLELIQLLYLFSSFVPAFLQLAGATELRFFISVYLVLYYYVIYKVRYKELYIKTKPHFAKIIILSIVIIVFWISNVSTILSYNREKTLLINDYYTIERK